MVCMDVNVVPEHEKEASEPTISELQGELSALRLKQRYLDESRREALNKILDIKGSIRVFCRVRASLLKDKRKVQLPISTGSEKITVRSVGTRKEFIVDKVFPQEATQEDVFVEVEPILRSAVDGHNVCIFAYGQTGTGKTFTMEGMTEQPGIVPQAIEKLFCQASEDKSASFTFSMSMLEVYMGNLRDLLAPKILTARVKELIHKSLSIQAGNNGYVDIEGLTDVAIDEFKQANRWYAKGKRARSTSWTNVNEASSRSHCLTRITIRRSSNVGEGIEVSKLWMVDLGGSERLLKTGTTGQTFDEGKAINLSLSALGDVIAALKRKQNHIPYRNSKLTQILSDSLGDNSKVLMLVHISPFEEDVAETLCSLNFAKRARAIEFNRELSKDLRNHKDKCIAELNQQMKDAEEEIQKVRNLIQKTEYFMQEKFSFKAYDFLEDQKGSPRSTLILDCRDVTESPRTAEKAICKARSNSLPRFMTSTECSRQRHGPAGETSVRARMSRFQNGGAVDLLDLQSNGYSDPYFKSNPLKNKSVKCETNMSRPRNLPSFGNPENPSCNSADSKATSITRSRRVSTSHSNLRVTLSQHRRRMSDLT